MLLSMQHVEQHGMNTQAYTQCTSVEQCPSGLVRLSSKQELSLI